MSQGAEHAIRQAHLFLEVGAVIIAVKLVVALCSKLRLAPVFGMVILGVVIGPGVLHLIDNNAVLEFLGSIGVMMLLFLAGLETDPTEMKNNGKVSFLSACGGVLLPFTAGFFLAYFSGHPLGNCCFTGAILTATSVSVTVMTLWDLGKLKSFLGVSVLSAAIIDDVMGLMILVFIMGFFGGQSGVMLSLAKIFLFLGGGALVGVYILPPVQRWIHKLDAPQMPLSFAFAMMFFYAGIAELCEIAPITGAYMAGLFLGRLEKRHQLLQQVEEIAQSFFTPLFFASIGLVASFKAVRAHVFYLGAFVFLACVSKIIGSGLMARISGLSWLQSLRIGIGMMPRGEVALVIASIGLSAELIGPLEFDATVLLVIVSAAITPILLKSSYRDHAVDGSED